MQLILLAVIIEKSNGRRSYVRDVARSLNMGYLKFLCHMDDMLTLRDKWYIRIDSDDRITVPADVLLSVPRTPRGEKKAVSAASEEEPEQNKQSSPANGSLKVK